jgi:hypothetical protein
VGRRSNILTIALFGLMLATPGILTIFNVSLTDPVDEKRVKAPRPDLSGCLNSGRFDTCHLEVDGWFNDHYKPRDLLIKLKTQIDYSLFSTSDKVHIGPSNWLYYRSTMDHEKVFNERLSQENFDRLLDDFDRLDGYLAGRGIRLVVLPLPLKDVIYPEYLPGSVPSLPADSRYQQLREWLAGHDSIITVDAAALLAELKKDLPVFHKTDFHWNDPAGFRYSQALVNTLWAIQSGRSEPLWDADPVIRREVSSGGQANFLPLVSRPSENALFLEGTPGPLKGTIDYAPEPPWDYIYDGAGDERGKLGLAVILSDSFYDAMHRAAVDSYFSGVYRVRNFSVDMDELYERLPAETRYLVIEFIEPGIFSYAATGLSVPGPGD